MRVLHFLFSPNLAICIQDVWNKDYFIEKIVRKLSLEKERFTGKKFLHVPFLWLDIGRELLTSPKFWDLCTDVNYLTKLLLLSVFLVSTCKRRFSRACSRIFDIFCVRNVWLDNQLTFVGNLEIMLGKFSWIFEIFQGYVWGEKENSNVFAATPKD